MGETVLPDLAPIQVSSEQIDRLEISVVICAYTEARWDALCQALEAVHNQTYPPLEVILVIDHNRPLYERARPQFPDTIVVENNQEQGLSGARNTALGLINGDVIVFVDEDAIPQPDWLDQLWHGYEDPAVIGVGGAIEPLWEGSRPAWFPPEFDWVVGCTYLGLPETSGPVRNLIGCNMSFRKEAFAQVGGFRSGLGRVGVLPEGCEETELCIRLRQDWPGKELIYQPAARVRHRIPAHRANWKYFRDRCFAEGISKAKVSQLVGSQDGLSSERAYMLRTLPRGVTAGIRDTLLKGDPDGVRRSAAILFGLFLTAAGFLSTKYSLSLKR